MTHIVTVSHLAKRRMAAGFLQNAPFVRPFDETLCRANNLRFPISSVNTPSRCLGRISAVAACWIVVVLLFSAFSTQSAVAQTTPEYEVDVVTVKAKDGSQGAQVEIYTRIPYSKLRFLATPNGFTARYEVSVEIVELDEDGRRQNIVQSPIWELTVKVPNYAETQASERFDFSTHTLKLVPGQYVFQFQIEDKSSNESFLNEVLFNVKDLDTPVAISDLLLLESFDDKTNTIFPRVAKKVSSMDSEMVLFYELYVDSLQRVNIRKEVVRIGSTVAAKSGVIEGSEIVSTTEESMKLTTSRTQHISRIKIDEFPVGTYDVIVSVLDESGRLLAAANSAFEVDWSGLEEHLANLNDAISQLQYTAKSKDIRYIKDGSTDGEKWSRFEQFWQRRDPTPGTVRNERMEEYYYRVAYANRRYSMVTDGWRTDRGQVMVLYGQPDTIEYHPFNFSVKPYEVWYYYRVGRRFIFVDDSGLGDYELLVPIYDETTHIR